MVANIRFEAFKNCHGFQGLANASHQGCAPEPYYGVHSFSWASTTLVIYCHVEQIVVQNNYPEKSM